MGIGEWSSERMTIITSSRTSRIRLSAATVALAGLALTGCAAESHLAFDFVHPFDAPIPATFDDIDPAFANDRDFVWEVAGRSDQAIRGFAPVVVYPPGDEESIPLPDDYVGYLDAITEGDAVISDVTVDGIVGQRIDFTTDEGTPQASLGCVADDLPADDGGCLGLQGDRIYRIVVLERDDETLLFWVRTGAARGADEEFFAEFDTWLAGIRFTS